jgi:hypothetical protein
MTERPGRTAGWGALAVVAPAAAVGLAAATGWAIANPPATAPAGTSTAAPVGRPDATTDKPLARLERQALAERARVVALQATLQRLRARTAAIRDAPPPSSGSVLAPPPPAAPAQQPAPATHTSTGAS